MKIALVNYRYFISGGPERYYFNIKEVYVRTGDGEHDMRKMIIIDPNVQGEIYSLMEEK